MTDTKPTGKCPTCGRTFQLTNAGRLRKHWARDGMDNGLPFSDPCRGSGAKIGKDNR